ncbi:Cthe_2314 family HEPN domain-containing protein [Vibrio parahaemolyticus]|nr:Cthe_2314 family HEPN domain-containing protein [Vibrio parahaemolyticus]MDF5237625.1 Cthe_2314 family HEPN domain-containing protein [Vibrio parahaemolyticus]MDF5404264.1 Cthe_2314 family HEPN domain-containing protein [Vibrio parahaemolyticus]MDG2830006.1 Cthe_2314 family HEPN domain-containing protein [Vibrio parahaemolyticus]MDG2932280.1 Cthe_2314 family HEPN domain-containing protein [Vibrio parahaemolyticus]
MNEIVLDPENPLQTKKFSTEGGKFEFELPSYKDFYMLSSAKALSNLGSALKNARLSLALLESEALNAIAKDDLEKSDLIKLWVENSIIRVQSVYDRVLIFVNKILDLGIPNDGISHLAITTNDHVKRYELDNLIKAVNKSCKEYKYIRNTVIHHERYSEGLLDNLTLLLDANHMSLAAGKDELLPENQLNLMVNMYLSSKQSELTVYLDGIEEKIHALYDKCIPIYRHMKTVLA